MYIYATQTPLHATLCYICPMVPRLPPIHHPLRLSWISCRSWGILARCIVFRKYRGTIGRTPQAKEFKATQGRWPVKSCKVVLGLLKNAEANAEFKNLDTEKLFVEHIQVASRRSRKKEG